jgi:tetratricopeptide (TPR) repeat protein
MEALAFEQAAGYCEAALPVLTGDGALLRCELLGDLGEARWRSGDENAARQAFSEAAALARGLGQSELLARAALGYGCGLGGAGNAVRVDPALLDLLDEALAALPEEDHPLRVQLLGRLAAELYFTDDADRREAAGQEAVAVAQRLGDPHAQLIALYSRHWSMLGPDGVEERQAAGPELVRIAGEVGDAEMAFRGHYMRLRTALELGDVTTADGALESCAALADDLRQPFYTWQTLVLQATNALAEARLPDGERLAREAFDIGQRVAPQAATTAFGAHIAQHRLLTGRIEEVLPRLRDRAESLPGEPIWRACVAWFCAEGGLFEEATATFDAMATAGFDRLPRNGNWTTTIGQGLGRTCGLLGDADRAAGLYSLLLPYQGRFAITTTGGARFCSNDALLGLLAATMGRLDDAARHFEESLRRDAACGNRAYMVLTARDYGRMLVRRRAPGDIERARQVVAEALMTARAAGMTKLVDQLEAQRP